MLTNTGRFFFGGVLTNTERFFFGGVLTNTERFFFFHFDHIDKLLTLKALLMSLSLLRRFFAFQNVFEALYAIFRKKSIFSKKKGVDKHLQNILKSQKSLDNARIFSYGFNYQIAVQCKRFEQKISYELGDSQKNRIKRPLFFTEYGRLPVFRHV